MVIGYYSLMKLDRDSTLRQLQALIADVLRNPELPDTVDRLQAIGSLEASDLVESFKEITLKMGADRQSRERLATVLYDLMDSPYPAGALINFRRFADTVATPSTFLDTLAGSKPIRELLATVFGASQYMSDIIIRNPGYLYWLIDKQTWEHVETKEDLLAALCSNMSTLDTVDGKLNAARRLQRRRLLKIGAQDLLGLRTIEETTLSLSRLASAIVTGVLEVLWKATPGLEASEVNSGFTVLALGKLGGEELNYSSDIDLIYLCADVGDETIALYQSLASALTTALSDVSAEGYLYRVDLRLRPDGDVGPLVNPLNSMMIYYENRGRPWEFQAMLKARVVAGDQSLGSRFLDSIAGLAFNPTSAYSPIESISLMRGKIRENISPRDRSFNIKLMEGGIRDIEFIVQTLQLLHGAKHRSLRVTNTISGVIAAHKQKLLKKVEHRTLLAAYRFFRLVEHRLQMMHQLKTHSIPESARDIELVAKRVSKGPLGEYTHDEFLLTLSTHLNKVRMISNSFFGGEELVESATLLLLPENDDSVHDTLLKFNLADTRHALSVLQSLAYGSFPQLVDRGTQASFRKLLPLLLEELAKTGNPNGALINFARIAAATTNTRSFYDTLAESEPYRAMIRDVVGSSSALTTKLCGNLEILERLREHPAGLIESPAFAEGGPWPFATVSRADDIDALYRRVHKELDRRILAAWILDIDKGTFPETMARTTTGAVRGLVRTCFDSFMKQQDGVALLALGSYGIGEPRPGSDLDLLVVTKDLELEPVTRAIQKLNNQLAERNLVKLDFRLRGEGANAPLVQDIDFYRQYFAKRMSPWERVAFAKCSWWGGDHSLAGEFVQSLMPYLTETPTQKHIGSLKETRAKLEAIVPGGTELLETKRSRGGRYDIEYLCSLGLASLGRAFDLGLPTAKRLELLVEGGLLKKKDCKEMIEAALFYERLEVLLELADLPQPTNLERVEAMLRYLETTMQLLGIPVGEKLETTMKKYKRNVRTCYQNFVDTLG